MTAPAIEVAGLRKIYRRPPWRRRGEGVGVRDVSLEVGRGESWLIAGPNGAGKTTTLHCILGLLRPDAGVVRVLGEAPRAARRRLGYQPEIFFSYPFLTAGQCLDLHGRLAGMASERLAARRARVLADLGLEDAADRRLGGFSKGMLQRLGLAQSLLDEPDVVIWDEPTSGLDPAGRRLVLDLARALRAAGRTLLFSTHVLGDVEQVCDHVAIIAGGSCRRAGPVAALLAAGGHASLEALYFAEVGRGGDAAAGA